MSNKLQLQTNNTRLASLIDELKRKADELLWLYKTIISYATSQHNLINEN